MKHHNTVTRVAIVSTSILLASACTAEPSDEPPLLTPIRAPAVPAAAPLEEGLLLDRFLAGDIIEEPLFFVGDKPFVRFEVDGELLYAELRPGDSDLSMERLAFATTARVQLLSIETDLAERSLTGRAMFDFLANRPDRLQGGRARLTLDPAGGVSDPVHEITVTFVPGFYGISPDCREDSFWEECSAATDDDPCSYTDQVTCHAWTWVQQQIQVTCPDGTVRPSFTWQLSSTTYQTPLVLTGRCMSLDFPFLDPTTPDDGCYCVVTGQPNCPPPPTQPPPPAPSPCTNQCQPGQPNQQKAGATETAVSCGGVVIN